LVLCCVCCCLPCMVCASNIDDGANGPRPPLAIRLIEHKPSEGGGHTVSIVPSPVSSVPPSPTLSRPIPSDTQ
jgi:hypothetical protein